MRLTKHQKIILYICRSMIKSQTGDDIDCELGNLKDTDIWYCCPSTIGFIKCLDTIGTLIKRKILVRNPDKTISFSDKSEYYNIVCNKLGEIHYKNSGLTPHIIDEWKNKIAVKQPI